MGKPPFVVRCYLCRERRSIEQTEVTRYRVPSAARGGVVQGVSRYVRMCRVGTGCKADPAVAPPSQYFLPTSDRQVEQ